MQITSDIELSGAGCTTAITPNQLVQSSSENDTSRVELVERHMAVLIACIEDPSVAIRMEGGLPEYSPATHEFRLNRPIGDDWLQYIRHVPNPPPVIVRTEESTSFVVFERRDDAERFEQWLIDAREEQDRGFRTMRG